MAAEYQDRTVKRVLTAPKLPESPKVRDILQYRSALDATLPPTPLRDLLSASGANVCVLSADPELQDTLQRAGGDQYPVYAVAEWAELRAAIEDDRCGIAVLDAELLGQRLAQCIVELERFDHRVVTLVAAGRADAQNLIGFLSNRKIHRLLIKPPALGITRLLLESAVSRCIQLRERVEAREAPPAQDAPRARGAAAARLGGPRLSAWLLATALVSLLIGAVVVASFRPFWSRGGSEAPRASAPAVVEVAPAAPPADRFADLLTRANRAFMEGRLAEPGGDNALDYYLAVLAVDPAHAVARERLAVVLDALFGQAEAALLGGSLDSAAAALASVRRADPESSRLAFLNAQLDRARAAAMAPRERAAEEPAARPVVESTARPPPAVLESLLTIAAARMQRGQLIEPAGDSARDYIARAAQLSPADPGVAQARAALGTALVTAAGAAVKDGNVDAAGKLLDEARAFGVRSDLLALVDGELGAARAAQESQRRNAMFDTARQRIEAGALIRPEGESALDQMLAVDAAFPGSVGVSSPWNELVRALAANAGAALDRGAVTEAEPWVAALERSGREPGTTAALRQRLATLRLRQQYLMSWAPASELALVSYTQPVYPREALRDNVDGWVDLEFIVDANGRPRELKAIGSQPSGRFERAAIDAVSQYRYEPFVRDGETYERLVRLRIRFTLQ